MSAHALRDPEQWREVPRLAPVEHLRCRVSGQEGRDRFGQGMLASRLHNILTIPDRVTKSIFGAEAAH